MGSGLSVRQEGKISRGSAKWIVCVLCMASGFTQTGSWEGFQAAVRHTMEAPVVCFSPNKTINAKLPGVAVGTNGSGVSILREFDHGIFRWQTAIPGGFAVSTDMNYFNADTNPDIVVPSYWGGSFTVYLGASDGSFAPGETYQVEGHCTWVITGDFNEDGKVDIAAAHNGSGQPLHLYIYLGNGDGMFSRFQKYPTPFATPTKAIVADVNNDKHLDISYSLSGPECGVVFLGNGDGTFQEPKLIASFDSTNANGSSEGFSLADINADGNIDWIGAQEFLDSVVVRLGDGKGGFVRGASLYFPHSFDVETADVNGDGAIDIIASNLDSVVCFLQNQQGSFSLSAAIHSEHGLAKLLMHDFDNDGLPDIIVSNLDSAFSVALNKGNSTTGVEQTDVHPSDVALFQNYPNPFNPATVISYQLSKRSRVNLTLYDVLGNEISTLVDGVNEPGYHELHFDASQLASGVYIYRLRTENSVKARKMTVVK